MLRVIASWTRGATFPLVRGWRICRASTVCGDFRRQAHVDGVTVVATEKAAHIALAELRRLQTRPHAWDTETTDVAIGAKGRSQSPVCHGKVICATCFCGDDADFGSGPRLFVDNSGPAEGLLELFKPYFEDNCFQKVFHNYSFDRHMLRRHGISLRGFHADTLHMARLFDTSRSSWEGRVKAKLGWSSARSASAELHGTLRDPGKCAPQSRAIAGVRLGGTTLERSAWAGQCGLHTLRLPSPELPSGLGQGGPVDASLSGYGLKNLALHFGISAEANKFGALFGVHRTAAQEAHDSPDSFPRWARYAAADAEMTFGVFGRLQGELATRPWHTPVHARPIFEVLRDPNVVLELRRQKSVTYGSVQYSTGITMWNFYELYLRDFGECLADMEEVGVGVDLDRLEQLEEKASRRVEECCKDFAESFASLRGPDGNQLNPDADLINVRSSTQLRLLLFGGARNRKDKSLTLEGAKEFPARGKEGKKRFTVTSLGLEPSTKAKDFSESGWPSTSSKVLSQLAGNPSQGKVGLAYEQLTQNGLAPDQAEHASHGLRRLSDANRVKPLVTGFVQPLLEHGRATGRIHPSWQWDTATGRLACRSPNLQNLPSSALEAFGPRDCFRPAPGSVFVIADYSQLELRVLAHVADCSSMIERLSRGGDYHSEVAAEMFPHVGKAIAAGEALINSGGPGAPPTVKELFPSERSKAKAINFGIIYGIGPGTLAEDLGVPRPEAEALIEAWLRSKPEVRKWTEAIKREGMRTQAVVSILGRSRHLPFLAQKADPALRSRSLRAAVNFGVQGSAADIVLAAMLQLWRHRWLADHGFRTVLQVHDEFVLEGPKEYGAEAAEVVRDVMMNPFREYNPNYQFKVPLSVDVAVGESFGKA